MARRSGLGKGLGALIPTGESVDSASTELQEIPVSRIKPNQHQPRAYFDEEALVVADRLGPRARGAPADPGAAGRRRRVRAHRRRAPVAGGQAGRPADGARRSSAPWRTPRALEQALVENLHREDLNALEEAAAYQQLIEDFGLTQEEVALRVGKSRSAVTNTLRLFQLPPSVQKLVAERKLSRRPRPGPARLARSAVPGDAGPAGRHRGAVGPRGRGDRPGQGGGRRARARPSRAEADARAGPPPGRPARARGAAVGPPGHPGQRDDGGQAGRVVVDFATVEDLERIYRTMTEGRETED